MAWVHDFAITEGVVAAAATGDANMPEHQADDMLIVLAAKDATGALAYVAGSGYTALSGAAGGAQWVGAWYQRATSSTMPAPAFTLTSDEYNIIVVSVRGAATGATVPTSAITTDDATMAGGGYLIDQTLDSTANSIILFGAGFDNNATGMGGEPMPGYGQVLYAGDVGTAGCSVWWQFYKSAGVSTSTYRSWGGVNDNTRVVKVLVQDDGSNTFEPGRIDLTSTFHKLYGALWSGTSPQVAPDTTWTHPVALSISMLGTDFDKVWTYDGSSFTNKTDDAKDDGTGDVAIANNNNTAIYFGSNTTFNSLCIDVGTAALGASVGTWEYSIGSSNWSTLTVVDIPNATNWASTWLVQGLGTVTFTRPTNWAKNAVSSDAGDGYYYVRRVVTDNWATSGPTLDQALKNGRPLLYDAVVGTADSGINPYHASFTITPAAGGASSYLQHSGGEYVASPSTGDVNCEFGIPDWSSGYLLTSFHLTAPRDLIDLGLYDLHKGAAITLMDTGVSARNLTSNFSNTDATSYTTASVTLIAGRLYLLCVENSKASAADAVSSIDNGPTFASRSTTTFNTSTANRVSIWSEVPATNYTGTLVINFGGGNTQTGCVWSLNEFSNVDTGTNDGIVQNAVGTGSSVTPLATLGGFSSAYNATVGAFGLGTALSGTPSTGYTELTDAAATAPGSSLQVVYRFDNDTTVDETVTSTPWGACAVEIKALATTDNNRTSWICGAKDSPDQNSAKRKVVAIQPSQTTDTAWARHGTLGTQGVDTFLGTASAPFGATSCFWSLLIKAGNHILSGGTTLLPLTFQQAAIALVNGANLFPVWDVNGDVADIWHPTQFGGGDDLHINLNLKTFQFPTRASAAAKTTQWHVDDDQVGFDFSGTINAFTGNTYSKGFNANTPAYTNEGTDWNDADVGDVALPPFQDTTSGDAIYFGHTSRFTTLLLNIGTAAATSGYTLQWQYYNGAWTALSGVTDGTSSFQTTGTNKVSWTLPTDWTSTTIDSQAAYWVKCVVTVQGTTSTNPLGTQGWINGDTIKLTNCLFTGGTPYYWRFNTNASTGADWDFSGSTVVGATVTLRSVYTFTTVTFNNCSEITLNGADIIDSTIRDTRATTSQGAIAFTSATEGDGIDQISFINNNDGDIGHSIRITTTGTYTFNAHTFSGGGVAERTFLTNSSGVDDGNDRINTDANHGYITGDAVYYQDQGGSETVGLTDGQLYYVSKFDDDTLSFHTTKAYALAGTPKVPLAPAGAETHHIYSAKADVFNNSGNAVIINLTNGADTPTIRESDNSTTTINNMVDLTVTVINANNSPIQNAQTAIFKTSDDSQLMNEDTNASGIATEQFNYPGSPVDIYIRVRRSSTGTTKYIPVSTTGQISSTGYTLTVTLFDDTTADPDI